MMAAVTAHCARFCALLWGVALLSAAASCDAVLRQVGDVTSVTPIASGVRVQLAGSGIADIALHFADAVRVHWNPSGAFSARSTGIVVAPQAALPGVQVFDAPSAVYIVSAAISIIVVKSPFQLIVLRSDGTLVDATLPAGLVFDSSSGLVLGQHYARPGEAYLGLGERGGPVDRRGRVLYLFNVDWAGYGEFSDPLYSGTPFYYALDGALAHGLFLDNAAVPFFDFDSANSGVLTFGAIKGELDYYVFSGPSTAAVAASFTLLVGPAPLPPLWTLGYHQSRYGYTSQAELMYVAQVFRALQVPADVLYLDIDYQDSYHQFTWSPNFPAPAAMNATLDAMGFKTVNIFDSCLVDGDPLRDAFAASGYLLKDGSGQPVVSSIFLGNVSFIDFTMPAARSAYSSLLSRFLASGISGTWIDLNEPAANFMPQAMYDFGGDPRPDSEGRNLYAFNQAKLFYETQLALRPTVRPWVLSRSGFTGIHRYAANWGGDELSTFESLRVSIEMSASMGLSGQQQFGHDIGGFLGSPSPELFIRWLQFASMTPLFRNHAMNTSPPREPWAYGEPYLTMARNVIEQRYRMLPYLYALHDEAGRSGAPVLAPTAWHFPADAATHAQSTEFMLGPLLLVAPVFTEGAVTRDVYLPAGTDWIDWLTDALYAGGQTVRIAAPLDRLPVFVRAGALLLSGPLKQYVGDAVQPAVVLDVYPGSYMSFSLYDDDGISMAYTGGAYARTVLTANSAGKTITVGAQRNGGTWQPPSRSWTLRLHRMSAAPVAVRADAVPLPQAAPGAQLDPRTGGWSYDTVHQMLLVRLPGTTELAQLTVSMP